MVEALGKQIEEVVRWQRRPSTQAIAATLEAGVERLYVEAVLGQFVRGRLSRKQAVKHVGAARVGSVNRESEHGPGLSR